MAHALAELGFCGVLTAAKERLKGANKKIKNKLKYIVFFICLCVHRFKVHRSGLPCIGWLWESGLPGQLPCLNILTRTSRNWKLKIDIAAKRRKKHKNKISGLVNSICYNQQKSKFRLFTNPSWFQIEYFRCRFAPSFLNGKNSSPSRRLIYSIVTR